MSVRIKGRRLTPDQVHYLVFEGGGGKGLAYVGAIQALSKLGILPQPLQCSRKLRGVCGASAGALTALFVSLGYSAEDILKEVTSNDFTTFLDMPRPGVLRGVRRRSGVTKAPELFGSVEPYEAFWGAPRPEGERWDRSFDQVDERRITERRAFATAIAGSPYLVILQLMVRIGRAVLRRNGGVYTGPFPAGILFGPLVMGMLPEALKDIKPLDANFWVDFILKQTGWESGSTSHTYLTKLFGTGEKDLADRLHALLFDRGAFSGFALRDYCAEKIQKALKLMTLEEGRNISFRALQRETGCDLRVTATNITQQYSGYFSATHTPDFPVADAITASMSLPLVFKPLLVNYPGPVVGGAEGKYTGLWVDGGLLTNLPIHGFDSFPTAGSAQYEVPLNPNVLALRLFDGDLPLKSQHLIRKSRSPRPWSELLDHAAELVETLLSPSEEGQIRSESERQQTIRIYGGRLSTLDFSSIHSNQAASYARQAVEDYFSGK